MPHSSCPPHQQDEQERKNSGHRSFITRRRVGEVERGRDKSCAVTVESSDAPGVGARGGRRRHRIGEPPGLRGWSVWLLMLRRCGLAPEDCRCEGMLGSGGRAPRSGVRTGRTPDLSCGQSPGPEDAGGVSGMLPGGVPPPAATPRPRRSPRPAWAPTWPLAAAGSRATWQPSGRSPPWTQSPCGRRAGRATARRSAGAAAAAAPSRLWPAPWHATPREARDETPRHATPRSAPPGAPPPTSGGGSCRPLLPGRGRAHACLARSRGAIRGAPGGRRACREDARRVRRRVSGTPAFHTKLSLAGAAPDRLGRDPG